MANPLRVLVIEDEERIRQFLQRGLSYEGYRVDVAVDGPSGLEIARDNPPDIVLLDVMLPGMNGIDHMTRNRHCPTVAARREILCKSFHHWQTGKDVD